MTTANANANGHSKTAAKKEQVEIPEKKVVLADTPANAVAQKWLASLDAALQKGDVAAASALFVKDSYWRDLVAFTWTLYTVEGPAGIADMLTANLERSKPSGWALTEDAAEDGGVTTAWFKFETSEGRGWGLVRIKEEDGEQKGWTFITALTELKDHEEPRGFRRPMGAEHGVNRHRLTWKEKKELEAQRLGTEDQPYVLILGGGQGGIALGARMRQMGVPSVVIDKSARPGDQWRGRYKSLCLHDPVWYDHLPYLKFPDNWPTFTPKDKIADWLEMYTNIMEVPYWSSTEAKKATYDDKKQEWVVDIVRDGKPMTLRPKHLVLATGMSGKMRVPKFPGQDIFKGEQQHSSQHPGPDAYEGKKVVVVGSNNSAFDICGALYEHGADVTMIQRSSTHIVKSSTLMDIALGGLYSEKAVQSGVTTEKADLIFASLPYRIMHEFQIPTYKAIAEHDKEYYKKLEDAGFLLDFGEDGSGLFLKYLRRGSGYYIDVGAAELVADGKVKLAHGQVDHLTEDGVVLDNGKELKADLVVYATGYGSMNGWAADLISQEVADKVGKVWGLGSNTILDPGPWEGEQRNMWKPTQQENLWFHGGNLHQSRHYSLYLALQLKARYEGIPTPIYKLQEVHHTG